MLVADPSASCTIATLLIVIGMVCMVMLVQCEERAWCRRHLARSVRDSFYSSSVSPQARARKCICMLQVRRATAAVRYKYRLRPRRVFLRSFFLREEWYNYKCGRKGLSETPR